MDLGQLDPLMLLACHLTCHVDYFHSTVPSIEYSVYQIYFLETVVLVTRFESQRAKVVFQLNPSGIGHINGNPLQVH